MLDDLKDFKFFAPNFFKVKDKDGAIVPFKLNRAQLYADAKIEAQLKKTGMVRVVALKGRQQGFSTMVQGRYTHKIITTTGKTAYILTHEGQATANLFGITNRFVDSMPPGLCPKPDVSTANKLEFRVFKSGYAIGTAGNRGAGRSQTIQLFHGSEVALWPHAEEHADGVMQAVPRSPGTEIILESTARGMGNYFHKMWNNAMSGESDYIPIFLPWYWQDEYAVEINEKFVMTEEEKEIFANHKDNGMTIGHIAWRRLKIAENVGEDGDENARKEKFKQEYPLTPIEAFRNSILDTFIKTAPVMRARKNEVDTDAGLIMGVDPAMGEIDKFTIIRRRARKAYKLERHINHNTMQIVGRLRNILDKEQPVKMYIDVIGIGAGVVDRLQELGYTMVEGINTARRADEPEKYSNKRAELWDIMRRWFNGESDVQIPDSDVLESDLCCLGYDHNSNGALVIEDKKKLKKRGLPSPDCFVAGTMINTPYGLSPIELLNVGDEVITPFGVTKIYATVVTQTDRLTTAKFNNKSVLIGKGKHKIFSWHNGFVPMDALSLTFDKVEEYSAWKIIKWKMLSLLCTKERNSEFKQVVDIISHQKNIKALDFFIALFGLSIMEKYQKVTSFITKIITGVTMIFRIWKPCHVQNMRVCTQENVLKIQKSGNKTKLIYRKQFLKLLNGTDQKKELNGIQNIQLRDGRIEKKKKCNVQYVKKNLKHILKIENPLDFVHINANKKKDINVISQMKEYVNGAARNLWQIVIGKSNVVPISVQTENVQMTNVYNLTLEKHNVYYANGILVTNCADALALTFAGGFYDISHGEQQTIEHKISTKGKFF